MENKRPPAKLTFLQPGFSTSAKTPFPVADNFFAPIQLSPDRVQKYEALADEYVVAALQQRKAFHDSAKVPNSKKYEVFEAPWIKAASMPNLCMFMRSHQSRSTAMRVQVLGLLNGNYKDFVNKFYPDARTTLLQTEKQLFPHVLDGAILHKRLPTPTHNLKLPLTTRVKWVMYDPPMVQFRMDVCHFEFCGFSYTQSGEKFGYRVCLPINLSQCPEFTDRYRGALRLASRSVMLYFPMEIPGNPSPMTEIFHVVQTDFRLESPVALGLVLYQAYLHGLANFLPVHIPRQTLPASLKTPAKKPKENIPFELPKDDTWAVSFTKRGGDCTICCQPFPILRSRHECYTCKAVVCKKCIMLPGISNDSSLRDKTCIKCYNLRGSIISKRATELSSSSSQLGQEDIESKKWPPPATFELSSTPGSVDCINKDPGTDFDESGYCVDFRSTSYSTMTASSGYDDSDFHLDFQNLTILSTPDSSTKSSLRGSSTGHEGNQILDDFDAISCIDTNNMVPVRFDRSRATSEQSSFSNQSYTSEYSENGTAVSNESITEGEIYYPSKNLVTSWKEVKGSNNSSTLPARRVNYTQSLEEVNRNLSEQQHVLRQMQKQFANIRGAEIAD